MARIPIPQSVDERARTFIRGREQAKFIRSYLTPLIAQGQELTGYERDRDGKLFAVTADFVPDVDDIPAPYRKKPKR